MNKKRLRVAKKSPMFEKKVIFGIRKFTVGVASVGIATAFLISGTGQLVQAEEVATPSTEITAPINTDQTSDVDATASVAGSELVEEVVTSDTTATEASTLVAEAGEVFDAQVNTASVEEVVTSDTTAAEASTLVAEASEAFDAQVNTASVENVATVAETATLSTPAEAPIEEGSIRLHFENVDETAPESQGLWTWGGVETPSDGNKWPTDTVNFSSSQVDDYGHYVDIKKSETPGTIGYVVLKDREKITESDQKVELLVPEQNEAWVASDYTVSSYEPLKDENVLRINYKREDNNYDGWGVWTWGGVETPSDGNKWPADAVDFKVGKYGAYVDIPLSNGLDSKLGFLLINQNNPDLAGNKSVDFAFADRKRHSQIFLQNGDDKVYTNPYFIEEKVELDTSKATPGTKNVTIEASINAPFNYNESGLVSVAITNPESAEIIKMEVDTTTLGGGIVPISTELNRVTIKATSDTAPGTYSLPVKVYDKDNGYYETKLDVTITERIKAEGEKDWDEQVIYFMMTDRFYNGDVSNDQKVVGDVTNPRGLYRGGDFKGVTAKLDYLKELGVDSIWLTPIVENIPQNVGSATDGEYYAYHGYWASNFEKLNPHLGSLADFHKLIDAAAEKGINIIVDVVLNHAGYGAEETFKGMVRTKEEDKQGDDQLGSLSGLPDFKTEEATVRNQLVAWQASWLERSKTAKGNSIYGFRVDTVKHVDDTTWQHFKNELVDRDPDFHLIGETWGANYKDTKGDLGIGTMDSLLDFGFKDIAKYLVNGQLKAAGKELEERSKVLTSAASLGQFLGSHDEDGFLYSLGGAEKEGNLDKLKLAASLLITAKGQPVIYYGEELGQSGQNNWPAYDNRYDFDWSKVETSDIEDHYQKLLAFRNGNSTLLSRGDTTTLAGNDSQGWLISKRRYQDQAAYLVFSTNTESQEMAIEVSGKDVVVTDAYTGKSYQAIEKDGKWVVQVELPTIGQGGTMLLQTEAGDIVNASVQGATEEPIEAGYFRVHFKTLPSDNLSSLGLWTWDDVEKPSSEVDAWPTGATNFSTAKQGDYGYYLDIKMKDETASKISLLINNTSGENITGDKVIERISTKMNEAWFDENYQLSLYQPLKEGYIRINYFRTDGDYDQKGLWIWGDVTDVTLGDWPDGIDFENQGKYGAYIDVKLTDLPSSIGFLLLDESKSGDDAKIQQKDYSFTDLKNQTQIFLKDDDPTIYTNPYFVNNVRVTGVSYVSLTALEAAFTTLEGADKESILEKLSVTDKNGQTVTVTDLVLDATSNKVRVLGDFNQENAGYTLKYGNDSFTTTMSWQLKDELYAYDGELGARVSQAGSVVDMTLWSPSADSVAVVLYDKDDQSKVVGKLAMTKGDKGQWDLELNSQSDLGIADYRGYYYHYEITRGDQSVLVLDPYAKSLAEWNSDLADTDPSYRIAKAAIVDPSEVGPSNLDYATIPNFNQREDAIIYEAHVRDFTSDPAISDELTAQFGTFAAFAERLSYLKELGVTHIQLLPVMSYYFVNELKNTERMDKYASSNSNYNWGYDPQSYFAFTGMYSTDPTDPMKRIEEFKNLVNEIHKQGMGVILDVVYNHTSKTFLFEDLEPNYYHFMEADGTAKSSFGGGRLGTTHYMSRRVLVDSIKYLVDEFKVDGFRFDMMGDHDAEAIELAFTEAQKLNPNIIMLGEGWRTFTGDANQPVQPADQDWMSSTDTVAVFSDEIRNTLKSGYPNEGQPAFITGGAKSVESVFNNIKAQPGNFLADDPGDVIQYIAAHDNLTLFDIIAQSIKKDPSIAENYTEIHQRQRLGNLLVLTSQGTPFIHSGQEYGRTKQFRHPDYQYPVAEDQVPNKAHLLTNADGTPFDYPYYIHDSYDSSDAVNKFDWTKATDETLYPENTRTQAFTKGLIALRKSTDAFRLGTKDQVDQKVSLISIPGQNGIATNDVVIAYQTIASNGDRYAVFVNADSKERSFVLSDIYKDLLQGQVLVDGERAGVEALSDLVGVELTDSAVVLAPLTATVIRLPYIITEVPDTAPKERTEESVLPIVEEVRYDATLAKGQSYVLQEGKAGKRVLVYKDVLVDGKVVATKLLSETVVDGEARIVVKGSMEANDVVEKPSLSTPTAQASEQTTSASNKESLPATGDRQSDLALLGLGLAGLGLTIAAQARNKKSEE
ncbi:pullulanase [Streptococcus parasuis]|uniref:pullulanase n=2 Tax=Streptococcus parasuis TaxID=1501662 RepID=UPI00289C1036|nr:pullulanase [Streptococcus parasuis]